MARIVMKFGGTSVANLERIRAVAEIIRREAAAGHKIAVVVSAMAGETNRLVGLFEESGGALPDLNESHIEHDVIVSSGEQVTTGLLANVLRHQGLRARSWQGWQAPLRTRGGYGDARIEGLEGDAFEQAVDDGEIAIVAGFQGVSPEGRIATLGRGGSDTSAVALAAAMEADFCDIYTDVDGVYTTDPRIAKAARRIEKISYEEMLEMASLGAKVLHTRSVALAMAYNVPLRVLSSFESPESRGPGTLICNEEDILEKNIVTAITPDFSEATVTVLAVPDEPGRAAMILSKLAAAGVNIDMIVQSPSRTANAANISLSTKGDSIDLATRVLADAKSEIGFEGLQANRDIAKISVIGIGMKSQTGVAATMFETLGAKGINIHNISTSEIKISVLIDADAAEYAVRALHEAYGLDAPQ